MTIHARLKADDRPLTGPNVAPLPIEPFVSKDFHNRFMSGVFRKTWINVGRVEDIPNNGDYFVKRMPTVDSGVLVMRGKDGVIRAMHNVCPHRGNELVWGDKGTCSRTISCRFHGWAFASDGSLAALTEPQFFPGLDTKNIRLTPIHLDTWRGFIFVWIDGSPTEDLETFLGETGRRLAPYPFENCPLKHRFTVELKSNWMIVMDAFQDAYHAAYLHSNWTTGEYGSQVLECFLDDRHRMASFSCPSRPKAGPIEEAALKYGTTGLYVTHEGDPIPGVNPGRHKNILFDCNVIFPNFFVDVTSFSYWVYRFWPDDYNRTTWEIDVYDRAPDNYVVAVSTAYNRVRMNAALAEDLATLERTQRALESGAVKELYVGDDEILVRHSYNAITDAVAKYTKEAGL